MSLPVHQSFCTTHHGHLITSCGLHLVESTVSFLSFPFLSFPFLSFPFLSFPFLSFPFLSVSSLELQKPASPVPTKHSLKYESQGTRIKEICRIWKRERTTLRFWWGFSRCLFSILRQLLFLWRRGVQNDSKRTVKLCNVSRLLWYPFSLCSPHIYYCFSQKKPITSSRTAVIGGPIFLCIPRGSIASPARADERRSTSRIGREQAEGTSLRAHRPFALIVDQ